ncbi:palmitoyltransferase ZDHHC13 [Microcaecilia unicolor]|uniref:Palmitoyltransferase n=1 Tax=Microcaecilia unicolor TaxID=1415580 RepID=A0A6P7XMK1_9AMPH|nr:palmitoyltransferase ZDHHC13 [Microcaecilia unicolor]XP_030056585.1 palmitoyltransferase ZDHHC13 [Microcaecilia unicolor]XP_030056587.1 palmitoyltransferase ZDHHC13 [Microcaecilia unicolor]XP_030056588.1 palmitoyltransferase ZDHHC13 [Microcaecilia unicolor]XP_030056589.1 palmitoyltransferase ZDHHC13 [Microcaecilia unicolor]
MHSSHGHKHGHHRPHGVHWQDTHLRESKGQLPQQEELPFLDDYSSWDIVKATQHGILERCKELVEAGYDVRQPDKENVTLLHWAAINNRQELVKYYISKGAIVDQLGGDLNSTPLHWAIRQGHLQMVILLLTYGADPTLIDGEGYCSIHLAVLFQHMPLIAYFLSTGQSIDLPDLNGITPLMLSAKQIIGPEPTGFLLKFNPSLNAVDKLQKNTALHWAILSGNVNAVDLLLGAGANCDVQNVKGETPLNLGLQTRNRLIIHMLREEEKLKHSRSFRLLKSLEKYELPLLLLVSTVVMWAVGYIADMNSDSWLLKGSLLAIMILGIQFFIRYFVSQKGQRCVPTVFFISSVFWAFITWFVWLLPDLGALVFQVPLILSTVGLIYNFYQTWRTDPGYIKTSEEERKQTIIALAEAGSLDYRMFCTSCLVKKPLRSNHCLICNSCVAKFDQHCVWTGHCIGAGNHQYFILFLFFLTVVGTWIIYAISVYWKSHCPTTYKQDGAWTFLTQIVFCSPWLLYIFTITLLHTSWAALMLVMQLYQIAFLGLTTHERMLLLMKSKHSKHPVSLRTTPFNHGCLKNLAEFFHWRCFGLAKHTEIDWTKQYMLLVDPTKLKSFQAV